MTWSHRARKGSNYHIKLIFFQSTTILRTKSKGRLGRSTPTGSIWGLYLYLIESVHKVVLHGSIPHKSVNSLFIFVIIKDNLADLLRRCSPLVSEIGNLLPNNRRQRRTCYALCHILYPVSAAHTSIFRMDSNSTSYAPLSHRTYLFIDLRKSNPSPNRQLTVFAITR